MKSIFVHLLYFVDGTVSSGCPRPCVTTKVGRPINIKGKSPNVNRPQDPMISLTLEQTLQITESFYPEFSLVRFFTDIGGSLGLWLGVGAVQFCMYVYDFILHFFNRK